MASLRYLWNNRATFSTSTPAFYRAWGKRLFTLPELIRRNRRRSFLIRKGAYVHETAEIGEVRAMGNKEMLTIGPMSFLGKIELALHTQIIIGERVCINDDVRLLTASHNVLDSKWRHVKSQIIIDDYAWICTGAIILPGVSIGKGAVVGAGAVVSKNVGPGEIVVGNPAKAISKKRCKNLDYNPCEFLAANQAWLVG